MTPQGAPPEDDVRPAGWFGRPGRSLTRRLIWLASAWILVALAATGLTLTSVFQESGLRRLGGVLNATIDEVVLATEVTPEGVRTTPIPDAQTLRVGSGKYWSVAEPAEDGGVRFLSRSRSLWDADLPIPDGLTGRLSAAFGRTLTYDVRTPSGEHLRVAATMKDLTGRDHPVIFMAGIDRANIDEDTRAFATVTWLALLLLGAGLAAAVFIQVRIGLRPLYALRNEIAEVRKGRAARIDAAYPLEIQPLAEQVNRLLAHNQEVVERQRTHVGNLAHALKTPLSVMLAEANSQQGFLPDLIRRQTQVMQAQVDHHLRRARAAARAQSFGERTPFDEVADELAVMLERVFETKGVEIDWRAPDALAFQGERQDLQEILGNLMENACKWCRRRVRVVAVELRPGVMRVTVEDDGEGLAEDQRETVVRRGARLDENAPGSGLGLSIVDELTRAYGGRLELTASPMGGLMAVLELPSAET